MRKGKGFSGMNRREFLKVGLVGTTSALLGGNTVAEAIGQYASSAPFVFPKPVYRTLGRTGQKITAVSFGAMLTPEAEVIRTAFELGVNYVDTARKYMDGKNEGIVAKALKGWRDKVHVATKTLPTSKLEEDIIRDVETSETSRGTGVQKASRAPEQLTPQTLPIPRSQRCRGPLTFMGTFLMVSVKVILF